MILKIKQFGIFLVLSLLFISACNSGIKPKEHLGEIYSVALDSIMEEDEALNSEMEYIAIDLNKIKAIEESVKVEILNYFKEKYKVEVMYANLEELRDMDLYNPDTLVLDGVLLKLDKVSFKFNNDIYFEGSKYRAGDGAIGVEGKIHYKNNKWETKEVKIPWIS